MKRTVYLLSALTAVFVILASAQTLAQEKTPVKVKGSEVVTGVVIVHVQKGAKTLDLQCNRERPPASLCRAGNYLMLELPENNGMYDCKNVEMYQGDQAKPDAAEKVGDYCLNDK